MSNRLPVFHKILLVFFAVSAASCSVHYDKPLPDAFVLKAVPFYPQEEYQCGPASLATVLDYYGTNSTPQMIAKEIYSKTARGTLTTDMILYAQKLGFKADQYSGSIEDIKKKVKDGYPLIVMVDFGFSAYEVNHFMVVRGFDSSGVVLNSGRHEAVRLDEDRFIDAWKKTRCWTLWIRK
ncbi:MAG: C39 family peptidase [Nitrospiraceae bacterium]|nr:C39 family peptidase [Nitrospiraceae bacterium]